MPSTEEFYPDGTGAGPLSYVARIRNFMAWVGQSLDVIEWDLRIIPDKKLIFGGSEAAGAAAWHNGVSGLTLRNNSGAFSIKNESPGSNLVLSARNSGDTDSYTALAVIGGANVYPIALFNGITRWRLANQGPVGYIGTVAPALSNSEIAWTHDVSGNLIGHVKEAGGTERTYTITPDP